jgi:hypothetical protein
MGRDPSFAALKRASAERLEELRAPDGRQRCRCPGRAAHALYLGLRPFGIVVVVAGLDADTFRIFTPSWRMLTKSQRPVLRPLRRYGSKREGRPSCGGS